MDQSGPTDPTQPMPRLLRISAVEGITGYKKSSIWAKVKSGDFPTPVKLSAHARAWRDHEIAEWVATRVKAEASSS